MTKDVFTILIGGKASIVDKYQTDSPSVGEVSHNLRLNILIGGFFNK